MEKSQRDLVVIVQELAGLEVLISPIPPRG
jgi:hypothetical protein